MSVQKIIEYQKIDMLVYKKQREMIKWPENARLSSLREEAQKQRNLLDTLSAELDKYYISLSSLDAKLDEEIKNSTKYEEDFSTYETVADYEKFDKNLTKYEETVNEIVKEIQKISKKINDINENNKKINDYILRLGAEYNKCGVLLETKKKQATEELRPTLIKLKSLEPSIDAKYLAKYKELRKAQKMPAFVACVDGSCQVCGSSIDMDRLTNTFDCVECSHCGRIVYKNN